MGICVRTIRGAERLVSDEKLNGCSVTPDDAVIVGLSGGPDSVALLISLLCARGRGRFGELSACHVHHGIRGESADADLAFCEALCGELGVPLTIARVDAPAEAKESGVSLETAARNLRYEALERARKEANADWIAVAHHKLDQAETVLMHLMRGAGLDGLCGMRRVNGRVIRPLLDVPREALLAFLADNGLRYRVDETNALPVAGRNRVRNELLPLFEALRPGSANAIADCAFRLAEDAAYLNDQAEKARVHARLSNGRYDKNALCQLPKPLLARAVFKILAEAGVPDAAASDVRRIAALLNAGNGTAIELRGGYLASVNAKALRVEKAHFPVRCEVPFCRDGDTILPVGVFRAKAVSAAAFPAKPNEAYLDLDRLPQDLLVRTRRDGDRFYPLGAPGERSLSDCFTDRKLSRAERNVPLLADETHVYWTPYYTVSETAKVTPSTEHILHIQFEEGT